MLDQQTKFADFTEIWLEQYAKQHLKERTLVGYRTLLDRILPAIGHIRLDRLQPHHLMAFYDNLAEEGIKQSGKYRCIIDLNATLQERKQSKASLSRVSGVSLAVLTAIGQGKNIARESAEKISTALGMPITTIFEAVEPKGKLSEKTILHHHRLISSILQVAVQWQVIPSNPCTRVKPPRVQKKEVKYLQENDARYMLEQLAQEDLEHRAMITLLLYSGMRRGELCGLEWSDIDFKNDIIEIRRNSVYIAKKGIVTTTPKTESSVRAEKLPHAVMDLLQKHKHQQNLNRLALGPDWIDSNRVFTQWNGQAASPDGVSKWFRLFMKRIGLEGYPLHSLRHTNASLMIASGVDVRTVAGRLGHAQTSTTTNIYSHIIKSADERASKAIEDILAQ